MKAIRRSIKGEKDQKHYTHGSIGPKSAIAIVPPKKVIKALYDYEPQNRHGHELAFRKGDFFHVLSREDDTEWYEACNPLLPDARGLVPVAFFEVIGKQQRQSGNSTKSSEAHDSGFSEKGTYGPTSSISGPQQVAGKPMAHARAGSAARNPGAMVYGIVLYDFNAERPDELEAKSGEPIIVVAQSNPEWFVAKPIGRLGGPGLIPVSFIDIKDTLTGQSVTDPLDAVRKAGVPRVEEWKKTAAEYKNSSITLGRIEQSQADVTRGMAGLSMQAEKSQSSNPYAQLPPTRPTQNPHVQSQHQPHQQNDMPLAPISASVPRYCFDNDKYWYIIECQMEDGRWFELSRYYADFYDFQIKLLDAFPEEAGNKGRPRTLPFMPGPVAHVTDAISNGRRQNLDEYIKQIIALPPYISKCMLVRNLFKPKPESDFEIDPSALTEEYRLSSTSQHSLRRLRSNTASRHSSGSQPNSNSGYGGMPPPGNARPAQPNGLGRPPLLHTQASTLTQNSTASSHRGGGASAASGNAMKVKVHFEEEIIIIRVPQDISFSGLKEKLIERLKVNDDIKVRYKDEATGSLVEMQNDDHLEHSIAVNPRLILYVRQASS